jgi:hypothetical protein
MPFTTGFGPTTVVSETGLWIYDGTRRVCVNYTYDTQSGLLTYAASVFRCSKAFNTESVIEPTHEQMIANAHTADRRFDMRPVIVQVASQLNYDDIISTIRKEMCHGFGVKGPRLPKPDSASDMASDGGDSSTSTSSNEFLSDLESSEHVKFEVDWEKLTSKPVRCLRYITSGLVENYYGEKQTVTREYFIAFRAIKKTGDLIYGAAISRLPDSYGMLDDSAVESHYETAIARLNKRPVHMVVSDEFCDQLKTNAPHREDVMYEIMDVIESRPGGRFLIRGL